MEEPTEIYKEIDSLYQSLSADHDWSELSDLIKKSHDLKFARENDHYWVRPNGEYGSRKPLNMGPRSEHSRTGGLAMSVEIGYNYWPHDNHGAISVRVKTREEAIRICASLIKHNSIIRMERLRTNARFS